MTSPTPGGFGEWVQGKSGRLNKTSLTPRHGSFIAAILREEGYLRCKGNKGTFVLKQLNSIAVKQPPPLNWPCLPPMS